MSAVGASHVDAVFDFNAAVGVELVDFVEGYAEDEVHEDVENAGGFLCALADPDFDVKFVGFLGAGDVSGGIWDDVLDVEDLHSRAAKDGDAAGGFFRKPGVNKRVALEFGFVPVVDATYAGHMRLLNESYAVLELAGC